MLMVHTVIHKACMLFPVINYTQADNNDKQRSLIRKSSLNTVFSTDYRGVTRIGLICPLYCVCCRNIDLARLCIMFFSVFATNRACCAQTGGHYQTFLLGSGGLKVREVSFVAIMLLIKPTDWQDTSGW